MSNLASLNPNLRHLTPAVPQTDWQKLLHEWLASKRSVHTQRVYQLDIERFLEAVDLSLGAFLRSDRHSAFAAVQRYRGMLLDSHLTSATINRRLSAIKSLVLYAFESGVCEFTLDYVKGEKLKQYRDTSGVELEQFQRMLNHCDLTTEKGLRDYALLYLLWGNALRRSEICRAKVSDFDPQSMTLRIFGKGKGNEAEAVSLGKGTINALENYLGQRENLTPDSPLFTSTNKGYQGRHLSGHALYKIVSQIGAAAGIQKLMSPHRIRHSAITTALDVTNGDVRAVQKLSRHSNLNTLMIYDDNRRNEQGRVTAILDDLL